MISSLCLNKLNARGANMEMPDIPECLDRRPLVHSFSSLNTYLNVCPHQYAARYVYKTAPFTGSPASIHGDEVHKALEQRLTHGTPLPEKYPYESFAAPIAEAKNVKIEQKYGIDTKGEPCDFFSRNVFLRGKVDVSIVSAGLKLAYVLDWKTGKVWEKPFELEIAGVFLKAHHPTLDKIVGQFAWLRENRLGTMHDVSDTQATMRTVLNAVKEIERDKREDKWEKRQGPLCSYCPVKMCEHNRSEL